MLPPFPPCSGYELPPDARGLGEPAYEAVASTPEDSARDSQGYEVPARQRLHTVTAAVGEPGVDEPGSHGSGPIRSAAPDTAEATSMSPVTARTGAALAAAEAPGVQLRPRARGGVLNVPKPKSAKDVRVSRRVQSVRRTGAERFTVSDQALASLRIDAGPRTAVEATAPQPTPLPPNAISQEMAAASDKLKTCGVFTNEILGRQLLEKSGHLMKRTKMKIWHQRWFVLRDRQLQWFAAQTDSVPSGTIQVDATLRIRRLPYDTATKLHQVLLSSPKRTLQLAAPSSREIEAWVSELTREYRDACRRSRAQTARITGWCDKVKNGFSRRRWCSLVDNAIHFSAKEQGSPLGSLSLEGARLESENPEEQSDPEDEIASGGAAPPAPFCLNVINGKGCYSLLFPSRGVRDTWAFFCGQSSGQ